MRAAHGRAGVDVIGDGDTIAAIATGGGGSVGVVRISGEKAVDVMRRVFMPSSASSAARRRRLDAHEQLESHRVYHGFVVERVDGEDAGGVVDEVLAILMRSPRSYTGEDVVELHTHGGGVHAKRVLDVVLGIGAAKSGAGGGDDERGQDAIARHARRGEFTQRAYLSGRIDLTQAEAVAAAVGASTPRQADIALAGVAGVVSSFTRRMRAECLSLVAEIEAGLDYGDELESEEAERGVATAMARVDAMLREVDGALAASRRNSVVVRGEVVVAVVGRPNAGKSSLVNALVGSDRFIVTSTPGTTRDVNEARVVLGGELEARLLDTAGMREIGRETAGGADVASADEIEMMGIARSASAAKVADAVLFVVDVTAGITPDDVDIYTEHIGDASRALLVLNKVDEMGDSRIAVHVPPAMRRRFGHEVCGGGNDDDDDDHDDDDEGANARRRRQRRCALVSARDGTGIERLRMQLLALVKGEGDATADGPAPIEDSALWCANARQEEGLARARDALELVRSSIASGMPSDLWVVDLRGAALHLGEVDGTEVALGEEVLDAIFATFCLGK